MIDYVECRGNEIRPERLYTSLLDCPPRASESETSHADLTLTWRWPHADLALTSRCTPQYLRQTHFGIKMVPLRSKKVIFGPIWVVWSTFEHRPWFLTSFGTHFELQNWQKINFVLNFFYLKFQLRKSMKIDYQISFFLLISLLSEKCDITDSSLPAVYYWCRHHNIISSRSTTTILI